MPIPPKTKKRVVPAPTNAPLWRVRTWLKKQNLFAAIDAAIETEKNTKPAIWEAWNHGHIVGRNDRLVKQLNLTANQIDNMFAAAAKSD